MATDFDDDFRRQFVKMMQDIYRVKQIEELAHTGTVRSIYKKINDGIEKGIEQETAPEEFYRQHSPFIQRLKTNTWYFSTAKNRADLVALNNMLVGDDGKFRTWNQFKKEAEKILGRSARYLKTEYVTSVAGARMATRWEKLQKMKHIYPNAKFYVVMDKSTTDICSPLHNVIVPLDHPLLKTHFPPNHFNCRTDVLGTSETATPDKNIVTPDIPDDFKNNIGITGKLFSENSKYLKALRKAFSNEEIDDFVYKVMSEDQSYIERYKSSKTGGIVRVNLNADLRDYPENFHIAKTIADFEPAKIDLLPHFEGRKNPELRVWRIIGDATNRKGLETGFVSTSFRKLRPGNQLADLEETFLALNFGDIKKLSNKEFKRIAVSLHDNLKWNKSVKFVYVIYNDKVIKIYGHDAVVDKGLDYVIKTLTPMKSERE